MSEVPLFLLILVAGFALPGGAVAGLSGLCRLSGPSFSSSSGGAFRGENVPRLRSGRRRGLGAMLLLPPQAEEKDVFRGGPGVGGFVDSGPEMPMPSASDRSTAKWIPMDSSVLSPARGGEGV